MVMDIFGFSAFRTVFKLLFGKEMFTYPILISISTLSSGGNGVLIYNRSFLTSLSILIIEICPDLGIIKFGNGRD
jgi:hypothetical protein